MLRNLNDLKDYAIHATDGDIGHVKDCYFDDEAWAVRYLVVDTGNWLPGRKVLISPISIRQPDWQEKTLPVSISQEQVKNSPDVDTEKPVSRQHESLYLGYYGYPMYWGGMGLWGPGAYPGVLIPSSTDMGTPSNLSRQPEFNELSAEAGEQDQHNDMHLHSCNDVVDYHIHATDGHIGHVSGFLLDDETWAIRYLIVDTSNWWLGHQVLIAPKWIEGIEWLDRTVNVDLTRDAIKEAVPYDKTADLDRDGEVDIYNHYGRVGYWAEDVETEKKIG